MWPLLPGGANEVDLSVGGKFGAVFISPVASSVGGPRDGLCDGVGAVVGGVRVWGVFGRNEHTLPAPPAPPSPPLPPPPPPPPAAGLDRGGWQAGQRGSGAVRSGAGTSAQRTDGGSSSKRN